MPQVISVGALDMVNFGPPDTVPEKFKGRRFYQHNPTVTLMRTTPEENDRLGKEIAEKASAARGPTAILLPLRGVSAIDAEGEPFWWPEADGRCSRASATGSARRCELIELDLHINDPAFARRRRPKRCWKWSRTRVDDVEVQAEPAKRGSTRQRPYVGIRSDACTGSSSGGESESRTLRRQALQDRRDYSATP